MSGSLFSAVAGDILLQAVPASLEARAVRSCLQQLVPSGAKLTLVSQPSLGSRVTPVFSSEVFLFAKSFVGVVRRYCSVPSG